MSLSHQYVQDHLLSMHRLTPSEQAALEEHLAACSECRAYAAFHQTLRQTLPAPAGSPRPAERDIHEKIQMVHARVEKHRWPARIVHHSLSFAGATVGLVLLFLILILTTRTMPGRPAIAPDVTRMAAGVASITPTATGASTPLPSTETTMPFLSSFPLYSGTTWVWMKTGYTQAEGDPQKIIQGTAKIEERVAEVQTVSSYQVAHILGNKVIVSSDPGWQENGTFGLGDYEYWYVVKDNQVYLSYQQPDPAQMKFEQMRLLYQFPLQVGSEWCPGSEIKGQPVLDIQSCGNKTVVTNKRPYTSSLGDFKTCYEIHVTANSGDVISQFCDGIGLVAQKYDHAGTRFGDDQQLVQFTNGKDGSTLTAKTPAVTPTTEKNGDIERIPSPDGRWTVLYRRQIGQLTIEDGQGKQTPVAVDGQDKYLVPGSWSPDSRYLLLWQGIDSASIQADGLPLWSIDVSTGNTFRISKSVLVNPGYSSWAPDGHALAFTNGGYRSAQVGKWLSLYTPADQKVTDLVPQEKLVPGLVAWSPDGKTIAFAAVDATLTGQEYADFSGWENPAILARRIYRLDPQTGMYQRLNSQEDFQDAPRWDLTGRLYFVQLTQTLARIMWVSDLAAGAAYAIPGCQGVRLTPAGYYGQIDWRFLFDACQATKAGGGITLTPSPIKTETSLNPQNRVVPAVALQGQTAYVGIGSRLAAIDLSQPTMLLLAVQSVELPGEVLKIISLPGGAGQRVAASAGRYLALLDTSITGELTLITQSKLPGPITALIFDIGNQTLYAGGALDGDAGKGFVAQLNATDLDTLQLFGTSQLPDPVQSLALTNGVLYAALTGDPPKVVAVPIHENTFGELTDVIVGTAVASMTTTGNLLFIGTDGQMLAYDLTQPLQPQFSWQISKSDGTPIPGNIFGFEVRPNIIFTAGRDADGTPFRLVLTPPAPLKTGSMVDTASCMAVSAGQMLVADERLEIYDSRDPQHLMLLGSYPLGVP